MPDIPLLAAGAAVLGLLLGSFLNVVIHRLPRMLERQWAQECASLQGQAAPTQSSYNLLVPRSNCPHCGHVIRWHENLPVVSYLALRGRCSACSASISPRYPAVELVSGCLLAWIALHWGLTPAAALWGVFALAIVALVCIDWDTTLLPDDITLPLLWLGLTGAALRWTPLSLTDALWGAVAGYLSLWSVYWLFRLTTGKEGMGFGDFKLFAALGAWFGWQALIPIILLASIVGTLVGIALKLGPGLREGGYLPFGPFLGGAGLVVMITGPAYWLRLIGW
jgi:leader peptidase (prepilin peptidase) / N-methyltransferase